MHLAQHSVNRSVTVSNVRFHVSVCTVHNTDTITLSGYVVVLYKQYIHKFPRDITFSVYPFPCLIPLTTFKYIQILTDIMTE